ncbi:MAG: Holliday junction branch migration protein RuvA [Alphaproteobacteria bacterium]|nr:Holliday junction branch migration protein RuvA [Alphaproteobacteria bacterium]
MIGYLSGNVQWLEPQGNLDQVIVLTHGVGYIVTCPGGVVQARIGEGTELWIHSITREDGTKLYGFSAISDVKGFVMMLDVPGVGAKVALALIAVLSWQGLLDTLVAGDSARLTQADGVGKKLAERIIHEMGAKLGKLNGLQGTDPAVMSAIVAQSSLTAEAVSALSNLGYSGTVAQQAVQSVQHQSPAENLESLITLALRLLHEQTPR